MNLKTTHLLLLAALALVGAVVLMMTGHDVPTWLPFVVFAALPTGAAGAPVYTAPAVPMQVASPAEIDRLPAEGA